MTDEKEKDWASEDGVEELKGLYAKWMEAKNAVEPPLPNLESRERRQEILSEHTAKKMQAAVDFLGPAIDAVPQLLEALDEAQRFANGFNGEMIGIIRSITDGAGADGVPFLDDAVRRIVSERDDARREARRLEVFGCYAGVPLLLQRPIHGVDEKQWHEFKKIFWAVIETGAESKSGRLPKDSAYGQVKSAMWVR